MGQEGVGEGRKAGADVGKQELCRPKGKGGSEPRGTRRELCSGAAEADFRLRTRVLFSLLKTDGQTHDLFSGSFFRLPFLPLQPACLRTVCFIFAVFENKLVSLSVSSL